MDDDKIVVLENIIKCFGYKLNIWDRKSMVSFLNKLLEDVVGKKE